MWGQGLGKGKVVSAPEIPLFFWGGGLSLHPIATNCGLHSPAPPTAAVSLPLSRWILLFFPPSGLFPPPLHLNQGCRKFYEFIRTIMDSPGRRVGRQQGETVLLEQMEGREKEKGIRERSEGGRCCCTAEF